MSRVALRFIGFWLKFTLQDATRAAFGWAAVPSGAILVGLLRYLGYAMNPHPQWGQIFLYALAGAGVAWLIAFLGHLIFISPFKAYFMLRPLALILDDDVDDAPIMKGQKYRSCSIGVIVKNRSAVHLHNCSLHIIKISETDDSDTPADGTWYPRLIERFDVAPKGSRRVSIAYWNSRSPPHTDDSTIGINGPLETDLAGT